VLSVVKKELGNTNYADNIDYFLPDLSFIALSPGLIPLDRVFSAYQVVIFHELIYIFAFSCPAELFPCSFH
jgi:hypothetical protein